MAAKGVNLDALIPREDLAIGEGVVSGEDGDNKLSMASLGGSTFFTGPLRKPEFQRETVHWSPTKIVELVEAFLDRKLIPAVILWRAGKYNFVIDGAHRLSALLAWVWDDYGDGERSKALFGSILPPEQVAIATNTRNLIKRKIGPYELYRAGLSHPGAVDDLTAERISNLSVAHLVAQWVPAATKDAAEDSFFKINDAATPLEPTERRILRSRGAATAIAARAIAHGGKGYAYWGHFADEEKRKAIVALSESIYTMLYKPPLASQGAIDTLDVPVAGRGYSILPFVFDLVSSVNSVKGADSTRKRSTTEKIARDDSGDETIRFIKNVNKSVSRITGTESTSLGLHPIIYFYTAGGTFSPWAFLAWSKIVDQMFERGKVIEFCEKRALIENFLWNDKGAMSEIVHKFGSGTRSTVQLERYWTYIINSFVSGLDEAGVQAAIAKDDTWKFLSLKTPIIRESEGEGTGRFSKATKTATIWQAAIPGAPRCSICGAIWHRNAIHVDHRTPLREGGTSNPANAQIAHPYCDSTYKDRKLPSLLSYGEA